MVYGTYNYSYWGESKPTNITGGPHIVGFQHLSRILSMTKEFATIHGMVKFVRIFISGFGGRKTPPAVKHDLQENPLFIVDVP